MNPENRGSRAGPHPFLARPETERAWRLIRALDGWTLSHQIELTSIPAPPFGEGPRGRRMADLLRDAGLEHVRIDEVGNVLGELPSTEEVSETAPAGTGPLILSAHLDTVFPSGTDVSPRHQENRVYAPGISDDGRGLAALLTAGRVLSEISFRFPFPIVLAATVGEEGPGNLRGVRFLLEGPGAIQRPRGFVSLDGVGLDRIIIRGVGSTRLRVTLTGPGGHSWTDFGCPNPIHVLGRIVAEAQTIPLPSAPKTTLTVARWGGGTSINAIPQEAWVEVDLRSESGEGLATLDRRFRDILEGGVGPQGLLLEVRDIGTRPAGATRESHPLVRAAMEATTILGESPQLTSSSTDANLPMAMGIPAVTLGAGGAGGGIHTLGEWYENTKGPEGILRAILTLVLLAGPLSG